MTTRLGDVHPDRLAVALAEYDKLKDEQASRIGTRDNLLYATLAAYALVGGAAIGEGGRVDVLLALPVVSVVLGWTYLANDQKVSQIGTYVRDQLARQLVGHLPDGATAFGWESRHRAAADRRRCKAFQLAVDLAAFCGSAVVALVVVWAAGASLPLLAVSVVELLAVGALAVEVVRTGRSAR